MRKLFLLFLVISLGIIYSGCNKDPEEPDKYYDFNTVSNDFMLTYLIHAEAYFMINDVLLSMEDSLEVHPDGVYQYDSALVTINPPDIDVYPKTFVLDYDATRALDSISGKISGTLSAKYLETGTEIIYLFDNYIVDGNKVVASDTLLNNGANNGTISFEQKILHSALIKDWSVRTNDMVTFDMIQSIYLDTANLQITIPEGNGSGRASDSLQFFVDINTDYPLIKEANCEFFWDGIFDYVVKEKDNSVIGEGVIDFWFPQGVCDKYAIIIVDGDGYRVELQFNMD